VSNVFERWNLYAAIPVRLALGSIFFVHGAQKLFGIWGGTGLEETARGLASIGLVPGLLWAIVAGVIELAGGAALIVGLLTRWTALVLGIDALVALLLVHLPAWTAGQGTVALQIAMLGGLVSLICSGAHRYALDERVPTLRKWSPPREVAKAA
jgi:putative oxidoreductase